MPKAILRPHQKHAYIIGTFISTGPPAVIIIRIPDENLGGRRNFGDYHAQLVAGRQFREVLEMVKIPS